MKNKTGLIILIIFFGIIILISVNVLRPAYQSGLISYNIACGKKNLSDYSDQNIGIIGWFDSKEDKIYICSNPGSEEYYETLKHESCHRFFHIKNISSTCFQRTRLILEETICYLYQKV